MGNQQQRGFQGKGNTLGTSATLSAPRTAPVRQQQQQKAAKNTNKGNRGAARRDPAAQNAARAAALEAAENRAKKFDNLVSKKKKERKKREQEKFEKNFNSRGGTMNLGAQNISGGNMDPQAAYRSLGNHSNSLGFDPTKSVISSSTTGSSCE